MKMIKPSIICPAVMLLLTSAAYVNRKHLEPVN
jgi:hypothetical protein